MAKIKLKRFQDLPTKTNVDVGDQVALYRTGYLELIPYTELHARFELDAGIQDLEGRVGDAEYQNVLQDSFIYENADDIIDAEARFLVEIANKQDLIDAAEARLDSAEIGLQQAEDLLGTVEGRVTFNETLISQNETEIELRATEVDVDAIEGRVTNAEASITINANEITQRVTLTVFDVVEGRVTDAETSIIQNAEEIALRATQSEVDTLSGEVSTNASSIIINAESITSLVEQVEYVGNVTGDDFTITPSGGYYTLTDAEATFTDNIKKGFTCVISDPEEEFDYTCFVREVVSDTEIIIDGPLGGYQNDAANTYKISGLATALSSQVEQLAGRISSRVTQVDYDQFYDGVWGDGGVADKVTVNETQITQTQKSILLLAYELDVVAQGSERQVRTNKAFIEVNADEIKLRVEQTVFDTLEGRVDTAESEITQNAGQITLRVTQATYDTDIGVIEGDIGDLDTRVGTAESEITQNSTDITLRVTQTQYDTEVGDLEGRVDTAESEISQNATDITLRVAQTTYDTDIGNIEGDIGNIEGDIDNIDGRVTTNESDILVALNQIKLQVYEQDVLLQGSEQIVRTNKASIEILSDAIITKVENDEIFSQMTQTADGFTYKANYVKSNDFNGTIVNGVITEPGTQGWAKDKQGAASYTKGWIGGAVIDGTKFKGYDEDGGFEIDWLNNVLKVFRDNGVTSGVEINLKNVFSTPGSLVTAANSSTFGIYQPVNPGNVGTISTWSPSDSYHNHVFDFDLSVGSQGNISADFVTGRYQLEFYNGSSWIVVDTDYFNFPATGTQSIRLSAVYREIYSQARVRVFCDASSDDDATPEDGTREYIIPKVEITPAGIQSASSSGIYSRFGSGESEIGGNLKVTNNIMVEGNAFKTGGGSWETLSDGGLKTVYSSVEEGIELLQQIGKGKWYMYKKETGIKGGLFAGFDARDGGIASKSKNIGGKNYKTFDWNTHQVVMHNTLLDQEEKIKALEDEIQGLREKIERSIN